MLSHWNQSLYPEFVTISRAGEAGQFSKEIGFKTSSSQTQHNLNSLPNFHEYFVKVVTGVSQFTLNPNLDIRFPQRILNPVFETQHLTSYQQCTILSTGQDVQIWALRCSTRRQLASIGPHIVKIDIPAQAGQRSTLMGQETSAIFRTMSSLNP